MPSEPSIERLEAAWDSLDKRMRKQLRHMAVQQHLSEVDTLLWPSRRQNVEYLKGAIERDTAIFLTMLNEFVTVQQLRRKAYEVVDINPSHDDAD